MKELKIRHFKFSPIIGIGYWIDNYDIIGNGSYCYNIVLPFIRIQYGKLFIDSK